MYDMGGAAGWEPEHRGAYGLSDPALEGFNPFKIITAPFRASVKAVKFGVRTAVKVAPRTVAGFLAAGPAGAIAGGASALIGGGGGEAQGAELYQQTLQALPTSGSAQYPRTSFAPTNPYSAQVQPYGVGMYAAPPRPQPSVGDQVRSVAMLLRDELLGAGARAVAETPQGRAAIQEKVTGDMGRYLLPISLGAGALVLTLALTRR